MNKFIIIFFLFIGVCKSFSAQHVEDNINPDPPVLRLVTVDITNISGGAILYWDSSPSPDVEQYDIFMSDPVSGAWNLLPIPASGSANSYIVPNSQAFKQSECFAICAEDSSHNRSIMVPLVGSHCTMYAFPYFDRCSASILLDWNPYTGWDSISSYKIYCRTQSSNYQYLGEVSGNESSFTHSNLQTNVQYCYYVEAISSDGLISHSNQTCVVTKLPVEPQYLIADYATVTADDEVQVSFQIDKQAEIDHYSLYRASSENDAFYKINTFPVSSLENITYDDKNLELNSGYCYKLVATDVCNREIRNSNLACVMMLSAESHNDLSFVLKWNKYRDFAGGTKKYNIYRTAQDYNTEFVKSIDPSIEPYFVDNVTFYTQNQYSSQNRLTGEFCYYIEAVEDSALNPLHKENHSKSIKACDVLNPRVFVPNCIYPNSDVAENRVFLPSVIYPSQGYVLGIYNRWGEKIFETENPFTGWDAKMKGGNFAPFGTYVYYLRFIDSKGELFQKSGEFVVLYQ